MSYYNIHVYKDTAGEWRWRKRPLYGGDTVADSGEGYTRKSDAIEAAAREKSKGDFVSTESGD